mgnify:CR=1 FL=1
MVVDKIHEKIREDLIKNQKELLNLKHYYTHKYRSQNRFLDINVGIFKIGNVSHVVQIYVADKHTKIRERLIMSNNQIVDTDIIVKRINEITN